MFLILLWDRPKKIRPGSFSQVPTDYHPQHNCHLVHVPYLLPALSILACFWWYDRAWKIVQVALFILLKVCSYFSLIPSPIPSSMHHLAEKHGCIYCNWCWCTGAEPLGLRQTLRLIMVGISENWRQNFVEVRRKPWTSLSCLNKLSFGCRRAKCRDILINVHIKDSMKLKCKCLKAAQKLSLYFQMY